MPTKLVVWNINRFSINTLNDTSGKTFAERFASLSQSAWNGGYIRNIGSTADIFVVIEVQSDRNILGSLVGGSGEPGVIFLLKWLKLNYNANWCVVPPLKLVGLTDSGEKANYTEGIAVFFRKDRVNFTGPYIWPDTGNIAVPQGSGTPAAYPDPWTDALPANNFFAGQYEFFKNPQNRTGTFSYISGNYRRPFLTNFTEVAGGRVIKLMSVHPSPKSTKVQVVNSIASIVEIQPSPSPQVVVVAGDFNLNTITTFNAFSGKFTGGEASEGYWGLRRKGFVQQISNTNAGTNGSTFLVPIAEGTPASYLTRKGIDNIFVRYDGGLVAPGPMNPRIIDPVTGTDEYAKQMLFSLADLNTYYDTTTKRVDAFRGLVNYGHIAHFAGASDHLPLVIDI